MCHSNDACVLRIAGHGLMNPVDKRRNACDNRLLASVEHKAVGSDQRPAVPLVLADKRASTVTLHATQSHHPAFSSMKFRTQYLAGVS